MARVSFELKHKDSDASQKEFSTLAGAWHHVRMELNDPSSWMIEQYVDGKFDDSINCLHLISRYNERESIPDLITEIKQ